ncbi:hypothetical protein ACF07Y_42680 [Streptomyces sp. NPDC016566]
MGISQKSSACSSRLTAHVADKTRYQLTIDPTEQTALSEGLAR